LEIFQLEEVIVSVAMRVTLPAQTVPTVSAKGSFSTSLLVKSTEKDNSGKLMLFFVLFYGKFEGKNNPLKTRRSSRGQFRQVHDVQSFQEQPKL
jgi:hypothetical protein